MAGGGLVPWLMPAVWFTGPIAGCPRTSHEGSAREGFEAVQLDFRSSLHEPGEPIPYVYFPSDGVLSLAC